MNDYFDLRCFHLQPSFASDLLGRRYMFLRALQLDGMPLADYFQIPLDLPFHLFNLSRQGVAFLGEIRLLGEQLLDKLLMTLHDHPVLVLQLLRPDSVMAFLRRHFVTGRLALGL